MKNLMRNPLGVFVSRCGNCAKFDVNSAAHIRAVDAERCASRARFAVGSTVAVRWKPSGSPDERPDESQPHEVEYLARITEAKQHSTGMVYTVAALYDGRTRRVDASRLRIAQVAA